MTEPGVVTRFRSRCAKTWLAGLNVELRAALEPLLGSNRYGMARSMSGTRSGSSS